MVEREIFYEGEGEVNGQILPAAEFSPLTTTKALNTYTVRKRSKFDPLLKQLRDHPGVPAKIAVYPTGHGNGGRHDSLAKARMDKVHLRNYLELNYPLEYWKIMTRTTPDTWFHRELWALFVGPQTDEERNARKAAQRAEHARRQQVAEVNREIRRKAERQRLLDQSQRDGGTAG